MSASLPDSVDAERMVAGRRSFEGTLKVAELPRLLGALADDHGQVDYRLDFEQREPAGPQLRVRLQADLTLQCQRTLEPFAFAAEVDVHLGLLADERDATALPGDCEPLLLVHGKLAPREVIADELLLSLPLVPVKPGSEAVQGDWNAPGEVSLDAATGEPVTHPFADLRKQLQARANRR